MWDAWKVDIVFTGNLAKFGQNDRALSELKSTWPDLLVEASPGDRVWGAGLRADDPRITDPGAWRGTNLLGRILTAVRTELRFR